MSNKKEGWPLMPHPFPPPPNPPPVPPRVKDWQALAPDQRVGICIWCRVPRTFQKSQQIGCYTCETCGWHIDAPW